ncbi:thiol reductant ABC exporter subunit CydD [Nitrincola tapanii]|uniref:Thiol reductant ABC exporter subunit CydD n=1 Tax=Nitrincola tapanii TaxID=1708751 RepID=A0A5A9W5E0_9GAMM|nr:thiol reductant ABC exporter subunit CydD [Nitrincola tapanii]KAA0875308.1 thiol reductant ABC exporter subunit CydD [Nitrincola tapanii]
MQHLSREVARAKSRWLKQLVAADQRWLRLSLIAALAAGLLLILQAHLLARAVDATLFHQAQLSDLTPLLWLLVVALLLRAALGVVREWSGQKASVAVRERLRNQLLARLAALGPAYTQSQRSGEISSLIIEQVEALDGFIARYLPQMALASLLPLVILAFVLPVNWAAALIFLFTAPLIPLFMALVGIKAADANRRNFRALARLSAYFLDVVQGLSTLKHFSRSREQTQIIAANAEEFRVRTMQVLRLAFLSSAVLEFFASVSIAILAVYLGFSFLGLLDFGSWGQGVTLYHALFILILAPEFYQPLRELGTHYHAKQEAVAASERLMDLLQEAETMQSSGQRQLPAVALDLTLENISFRYSAHGAWVLDQFSLHVPAGETLALVGPSGVGKSTVLNLLAGFNQVERGEVRIAGIPLAELERASWMGALSWISQQTVLFPGSLRDNLLLANPHADDAALWRACDLAQASEFIHPLPQGLDTPVAEAGQGFSGGQLQRLALARAFLRDAPVVLLDEPTASLDAESEAKVLQALKQLCVGRTVLLVTHRPSTQALADRVVSLAAPLGADEEGVRDV